MPIPEHPHPPVWILTGAFILALTAGCINAVGFLGLQHQAITHLTGVLSMISIDLAVSDFSAAGHAMIIVLSFFGGCLVCGLIVRGEKVRIGRRYGVVLALESALLLASVRLLGAGHFAGGCLAAGACGLQNAMATSYSGAIIRTSHMTGIVTDLGIALGHFIHRHPVEWARVRLHLALLGGFCAGGVFGAIGFRHLGYRTLLFPAALSGLTGLAHIINRHRRRVPAEAIA